MAEAGSTEKQMTVKVRINASGKRLIGCVDLPEGMERVSDLLNAPNPCILLTANGIMPPGKKPDHQIVFKHAITYLEAIEEPKFHTTSHHGGCFHPVVGELLEPNSQQIIAEIFVPFGMSLFEVMNDSRNFISLRNVHFSNFVERYPFLAVGKKHLILVST